MMLQALKEYYDRKAADPDSGIAPLGWERKEIPFLIVISSEGRFVNIEDTRETVGKKKVARKFLVPMGLKRSSGIASNTLWDNVEYATGIVCKGKASRVQEQHKAFVAKLSDFAAIPEVKAVVSYLDNGDEIAKLNGNTDFKEAIESCAFVSFKIVGGAETVAATESFVAAFNESRKVEGGIVARCLVTGSLELPAVLHPAIKGVYGANTTGGNIVSFNFPAACSFGKVQGMNAPVGESIAFAYSTALNTMLRADSRQKLHIGDTTVVFWTAKDDPFEETFATFFAEPLKDDPDRLTESVKALYRSVATGAYVYDTDDTRFYVLGLAPNSARLSVRSWTVGTVAELSTRLRAYFDDLEVVHGPKDMDHLSAWRLLISTAMQGKSENVNPSLAGNFMASALEGSPFSEALLQALLVRIKAERMVSYPRAKLVKGYLCRRFNLTSQERKELVSLNKENKNHGYRLGRLFATLEKIQTDANPGINATVRDRYYAAASSSPLTVFGNLMRMSNHWLSKLESEKPGLAIIRKQLLAEIIGEIAEFPAHLPIADQGFFALGYYHQQQDFFTKKNPVDDEKID